MGRTRIIFIGIIFIALLIALASFFMGGQKTVVVGVSGSEKQPFFEDARVIARLETLDLEVDVTKAG